MHDILIVGGGLLGRAIAFQLAQTGLHVAIVYQRSQHDGQASAAAGGMFGVFSEVTTTDEPARREIEVQERWLSRQLYKDWVACINEYSGLPVLIRDGLFVVANTIGQNDTPELDAIRASALAYQTRVEDILPHQVPGLAPQTKARAYAALYLHDEGSVDTRQLLRALDFCLEKHEKVQQIDDRVYTIQVMTDGVTATLRAGEPVQAACVILAGGVEIPRLLHDSRLQHLGLPPIFSGRGVSLTANIPITFPFPIRTPNRGFACGIHVVPRAEGIYIGATNRFSTTPDIEQGARLGEVNNLLTGVMQEINVGFRDAELLNVAVGHRPLTTDKLPLVGRTLDERILIASGTYRNGVLLTPRIAQLIDQEITQPGALATHPFSPRREVQSVSYADGWLREVSAKLIATLMEPNGELPYGRDIELQHMIYSFFSLLLNPDYDNARLKQKVERLLERAPLEEAIPLLFDMIARHAAP
jgi:glycine oxidase